MEDDVHTFHGRIDCRSVGHASFNEGVVEACEVMAVAGSQVVEHDYFGDALKVFDEMAANKTGSAGDENTHGRKKIIGYLLMGLVNVVISYVFLL
jgi:hypothetical protein